MDNPYFRPVCESLFQIPFYIMLSQKNEDIWPMHVFS